MISSFWALNFLVIYAFLGGVSLYLCHFLDSKRCHDKFLSDDDDEEDKYDNSKDNHKDDHRDHQTVQLNFALVSVLLTAHLQRLSDLMYTGFFCYSRVGLFLWPIDPELCLVP